MAEQNQQLYYSLVTKYGLGAMQNATFLQQQVAITHLAIGDGDGALYEPQSTQTELKKEVYRGQLNHVYVDADNPSMMVFECVIPQTSGGYTVREAGLFTSDGNLFAIAKVAETVKPLLEEGAAKELYVRIILELSNADAITIKIDPSIVLATQKWVTELFAPLSHVTNVNNPHQVTPKQIGLNFSSIEINQIFNSLKSGNLGTNGWSRDANGYTVQWGQGGAQATAQNKGKFWWSFPVPFSEPCYGISATDYAADETYHHDISVTTLTKGAMSGYVFMRDGSPMTSQETAFFIIAFGKISDEDFEAMTGE